jgi:hypothetical protein
MIVLWHANEELFPFLCASERHFVFFTHDGRSWCNFSLEAASVAVKKAATILLEVGQRTETALMCEAIGRGHEIRSSERRKCARSLWQRR